MVQNTAKKEKKRLVKRLRESRVFVGNKDPLADPKKVRLCELEASLEFLLRWKARIGRLFDEIYGESKYCQKAVYHYRKTLQGNPSDPDFKDVSFVENECLVNLAKRNMEVYKDCDFWPLEARPEYVPCAKNGRTVSFTPDEAHLDMLSRLNKVNEMSQELLRKISSVKKEIIKKRNKMTPCN